MQRYVIHAVGKWSAEAVNSGAWVRFDDANAEIVRLKGLLNVEYGPISQPQVLPLPPVLLPDPPSHEESYSNNLTQALRERDTLREVLQLLAPDLKAMAILYAGKGDYERSQALNNIVKSVGAA